MTQRASVSVPAPSPRTSMNLGNGWSSPNFARIAAAVAAS